MLALAYAAKHPETAGPIVLVGCGTWDLLSRSELAATLERRIEEDPALRRRLERLDDEYRDDPPARLAKYYELTHHLYDYDAVSEEPDAEAPAFDVDAHHQTWRDMVRLQGEGVYPAAFSRIKSPVLMLHGDYDPHPGPLICASLRQYVGQLEYRELLRCGHSPWRERFAREEFAAAMRGWLGEKLM
jgi:pimeloyl-ACP methyl ester carboxylesterase